MNTKTGLGLRKEKIRKEEFDDFLLTAFAAKTFCRQP